MTTTVIITVVVAAIIVAVFTQVDNWRRDFTTNYAALDPQNADPELRPLTIDLSPPEVADRVDRWQKQRSHWKLVSQSGDDTIEIHLTRSTRLFRFVDDIHITIQSTSNTQSYVVVESQSRMGKGDLGQNPRNLKEIRRVLLD